MGEGREGERESIVDICKGNWLTGLQRPRMPNMPSAWRGTRTSNGVTVCKQPSKTRCLRVGKRHHSSSGGESRHVSLPTLSLQTLMNLPQWRMQDILTPSSGASRTFSEIMLVHLRSAKLTHVVFVYIVPLPIKTGELGVGVPTW